MILEVGKAGKARFIRGIKKTNIFECGPNGLVLEREKNVITLYATNARCSEIYCVIPLGGNEILKKNKFVGVAYSPDIMLLDGGEILVVVDFAQKKVAVNKPEIKVVGKRDWAGDARMPWEPEFNAMFGLEAGTPVIADGSAAGETKPTAAVTEEQLEQFWTWFAGYEEELVEKTLEGGEAAELVKAKIRVKLAAVFHYAKPETIEFSLGGDGEKNELAVFHLNAEPMKTDAERLGEKMPGGLSERWNYRTEA